MWKKSNIIILVGMMTLLPSSLFAQGSAKAIDFEDLSVSYIYAAVMGMGTYKIEERQISMMRSTTKIGSTDCSMIT